jgi:hypothetical protein
VFPRHFECRIYTDTSKHFERRERRGIAEVKYKAGSEVRCGSFARCLLLRFFVGSFDFEVLCDLCVQIEVVESSAPSAFKAVIKCTEMLILGL